MLMTRQVREIFLSLLITNLCEARAFGLITENENQRIKECYGCLMTP